MKLKLSWFTRNEIWVTGFLRKGNCYLKQNELADYFGEVKTISDFKERLKSANGQFSVIIKRGDELWAAVDRVRNYPIFYTKIDGEFIISDNCYLVAEMLPEKKINPAARSSFLTAGFTLNNLTLLDKVFQVEAGSYVVFRESVNITFYHDLSDDKRISSDIIDAGSALKDLLNNIFRSHLEALKNKFIAIPLSGGFDSRLTAAMCSKYHPENILCYTYGSKNNIEVRPAKEVARRLGFKWINIVYDEDLIRGFLQDDSFKNYYQYVSGLSSMFFLQEYFAVRYLIINRIIPEESVFMPGFTGDVIAGNHLIPVMKNRMSKMHMAKIIFREHHKMIHLSHSERAGLLNLISERIPPECDNPWRVFEIWDMKERQAKFIINSAKLYRYFGFEYSLPFWDKQIVDFFSGLPFEFKLYKKLYDKTLTEIIFRDLGINLPEEINPTPAEKRIQEIKEKVKPLVPKMLRDLMLNMKSPIYYDEITKLLVNDAGSGNFISPVQPNYYNSYITQWYLMKTAKDVAIAEKQ